MQEEREGCPILPKGLIYVLYDIRQPWTPVAWPSWSKALDLSNLDSQWGKPRASSNLAATIRVCTLASFFFSGIHLEIALHIFYVYKIYFLDSLYITRKVSKNLVFTS